MDEMSLHRRPLAVQRMFEQAGYLPSVPQFPGST
jgi:hypothetical protein